MIVQVNFDCWNAGELFCLLEVLLLNRGLGSSICVSIILMYFFFFLKEMNHLFELFKRKPMNTQQVKETTQECS